MWVGEVPRASPLTDLTGNPYPLFSRGVCFSLFPFFPRTAVHASPAVVTSLSPCCRQTPLGLRARARDTNICYARGRGDVIAGLHAHLSCVACRVQPASRGVALCGNELQGFGLRSVITTTHRNLISTSHCFCGASWWQMNLVRWVRSGWTIAGNVCERERRTNTGLMYM